MTDEKQALKEEKDAKVLEMFTKSEARDIKKLIESGKREISEGIPDMATGNDHFLIDQKPEVTLDGNLKMGGKVVAIDPLMLPIQILNQNKFMIIWECKFKNRRPRIHLPFHWLVLPDQYWVPWIEFVGNTKHNGTPLKFKQNMGKSINYSLTKD